MAKLKKLPKKPRQSAPLSTWERYNERVKEVQKYNRQIESDAKKKSNLIKKLQNPSKK